MQRMRSIDWDRWEIVRGKRHHSKRYVCSDVIFSAGTNRTTQKVLYCYTVSADALLLLEWILWVSFAPLLFLLAFGTRQPNDTQPNCDILFIIKRMKQKAFLLLLSSAIGGVLSGAAGSTVKAFAIVPQPA